MSEERETDASSAERLDDLEHWRLRIFQFVLYLTLGFGLPTLIAWSLTKLEQGRGSVTLPMWAFYAAFGALALARPVSLRIRATTFLTCLFAAGTVAILEYGFRGQGPFLYLAVVTMTVVFLGFREGIVAFCISIAALAGTAFGFVHELLHDNALHPITALPPWVSLIATFLMVGISMLAAVGVLMRRLQTSLASERALVRDLRSQVETIEAARAETLRELRERQRAERRIEERDRVLKAVGFTAEKLLLSRHWEDCAADVVRAVGESAGVEHVTLAEVVTDPKRGLAVRHRFVWAAPGLTHWSEDPVLSERMAAREIVEPLLAALGRGEPVRIRAGEMSDDVRELARSISVAVATMLPITVDGELWGYIGLASSDPAGEIPEHITDLLRAAAGNLGAAVGRDRLNAELEARVIERTERLARANEEIEAFSYTISHDLRTPLRHVTAFAGMLRDENSGELPEKAAERVRVIADAAERMTRMIDDLLQFYQLGRASFATNELDLASLVAEVIAEHEHETQSRSIDWKVNDLPELRADRSLMKHVFSNLIGNAVKYTSSVEHAEITIGQEPGEREIVVYVRDNGVGFDPSQEHRLFHVFQRLHPLHDFEGSGIGLAHVRRIVERHGGRVWGKGAVGSGATFYLGFPVSARRA